jgi:hypothetical protein
VPMLTAEDSHVSVCCCFSNGNPASNTSAADAWDGRMAHASTTRVRRIDRSAEVTRRCIELAIVRTAPGRIASNTFWCSGTGITGWQMSAHLSAWTSIHGGLGLRIKVS